MIVIIDFNECLFLQYICFFITHKIFLFLQVKTLTEDWLAWNQQYHSCCIKYPLNQVYIQFRFGEHFGRGLFTYTLIYIYIYIYITINIYIYILLIYIKINGYSKVTINLSSTCFICYLPILFELWKQPKSFLMFSRA